MDKVKVYTRFTRSLHQTAMSHDVSYYITLFHHFSASFYLTLHYSNIVLLHTTLLYYGYTVEPPKTDSPYYENLHNADKSPRSRIIPYIIVYVHKKTSILRTPLK